MTFKTLALLLGAATMLSACMGPPPQRQISYATPQPMGIDGTWMDTNGVAVSTFQGGSFSSRSADSNTLLASGTYTNTSPTLVEISMTSLVRKTQSRVNCALVSQDQLNCTADSGANFSLRRRMAAQM